MAKSNIGVWLLGAGLVIAGVLIFLNLINFFGKKEYMIYNMILAVVVIALIILGLIFMYRAIKKAGEAEMQWEFWNGVYKLGWILIIPGIIMIFVGLIAYLLIVAGVISGEASLTKNLNALAIVGFVFIVFGGVIAYISHRKKLESKEIRVDEIDPKAKSDWLRKKTEVNEAKIKEQKEIVEQKPKEQSM